MIDRCHGWWLFYQKRVYNFCFVILIVWFLWLNILLFCMGCGVVMWVDHLLVVVFCLKLDLSRCWNEVFFALVLWGWVLLLCSIVFLWGCCRRSFWVLQLRIRWCGLHLIYWWIRRDSCQWVLKILWVFGCRWQNLCPCIILFLSRCQEYCIVWVVHNL